MLLTITTTHRPATDLGYLLYKMVGFRGSTQEKSPSEIFCFG